MKKVLIVVAGNNGTIGRCSLNLFRAFKERDDVEVKCVGVHRYDNGFEEFADCEFFSDYHGNHNSNIREHVKWLREIKNSYKPNLTISTLHSVNVLNCLVFANDIRVGIFHSPHKQGRVFGILRYILYVLPYWFLFKRLDLCSCVSKEVEDDLLSFRGIKRERIKTIYNIHLVDEILRKAEDDVQDKPDPPYFIYCGRLDANKAPIRAVKALAKSNTKVSLLIVGKGEEPFVSDFKEQVGKLGLSDRVILLGEKSNPYPYIKGAKALVSSSYSEGLPGVIIESLAIGVPVISTNSSRGIWEVLSVDDSYDNTLIDVFETKYGIITSNLAAKDSSSEELDIENLSKGYQMIEKYQQMPKPEFLEKIKREAITNQYISLISK